jgi:hypothetical protein
VLESDVTAKSTLLFNVAGANLTIVGKGATRTIAFEFPSTNATSVRIDGDGANLTIGENITMKGIANSTTGMMYVQNGTLTMLNGSKITGHTTSFTAVVYIGGNNALFTMEGGEISGNRTTSSFVHSASVYVSMNGTFVMKGGSIKDNFSAFNTPNSPADVFIYYDGGLLKSGNAVINTLTINATPTNCSSISIAGAYSGKVDALHLLGFDTNLNTVIDWWLGENIIKPATGYTLTANDISKFTLGEFRNAGTDTQKITGNTDKPNYKIDNTGKLVED